MSAQLTDEEALNRVASYCSTAEHCRAEINEKLQRWGIAYDTIARILDRLESEKFIDDERFCRAFVNDKFRFAKWGKMKIAQGRNYLFKADPSRACARRRGATF